jgi:hypothetical protein
VLDDRYPGDKQRKQFCCELAPRLSALFRVAYPEQTADEGCVQTVAALVAQSVVAADITSGFRRLFVQSFLTVLFRLSEGVLSSSEVDDIVRGQAQGVSISG